MPYCSGTCTLTTPRRRSVSRQRGHRGVAPWHSGGKGRTRSAATKRPRAALPWKRMDQLDPQMFQEALIDTSGGSLAKAPVAAPVAETSPAPRVPLQELEDGQRVKGVYAVRQRELRRKRNGEPWLRLVLGDASGSAEAVAWEGAETLYAVAAPGTAVEVSGTFELSERWGAKIKLSALREAALDEEIGRG